MTSVTQEALVRGIGENLQRSGRVNFPDAAHLKMACAAVATQYLAVEPVETALTHADVVKVGNALIQVSNDFNMSLHQQGKTAGALGRPLISQHTDAYGDLVEHVYKRAMSSDNQGGQVAGNPATNAPGNASSVVGQYENAERPDGYAQGPQGMVAGLQTTPQSARVGTEMPAPLADTAVTGGAAVNSAIAAAQNKSAGLASLEHLLNKLAVGSDNQGGQLASNPLTNAPGNASTIVGQYENAARPDGYAQGPQGLIAGLQTTPQTARIGTEMPAPGQDSAIVGGASTNSAILATKNARARALTNEEYMAAAAELLPMLPPAMPASEKVAACSAYASSTPAEQALHRLLLSQPRQQAAHPAR